MVTQSVNNYKKFKDDVREYYLSRNVDAEKEINQFIDYISQCYDGISRCFFSYKFMKYLYLRRHDVINKNQHFWIAFIGKKGGEGKSTLAKQALHFVDHSFHSDTRCAASFEKFIENIKQTKKIDKVAYPSLLLDEVDPKLHHASVDGRTLRSITTKVRQLNLFVGVCANTLNDIPAFIHDRINTIIKIDDHHRFWLYDNNYDSPKFSIVDDIKKEWNQSKHAIFKDKSIIKRAHMKNQSFSKELPFTEHTYLEEKDKDLFADIDLYLNSKNRKASPQAPALPVPDRMDTEIIKAKRAGESSASIAARFNRTHRMINMICKKFNHLLENSGNWKPRVF